MGNPIKEDGRDVRGLNEVNAQRSRELARLLGESISKLSRGDIDTSLELQGLMVELLADKFELESQIDAICIKAAKRS